MSQGDSTTHTTKCAALCCHNLKQHALGNSEIIFCILISDTPTSLKGYMDSILGTKTTCNGSTTSNGFMHSPTNPAPPVVQTE